ncbi:MAG: hypothetical protein ACR2NQ_00080 [Thermodesulfobacteriota bacterium]
MRSIVALSVCVLFLAGCGGAIYSQSSWSPPGDVNTATADWDVASAVCDVKAGNRELTPEEKKEIAGKKRDLQKAGSDFQKLMDEAGIGGGELVGGVFGFLSGLMGGASGKQDDVFVECMQNFGWER